MFDPQAHLMQLPRRALDRRTGEYRTIYEDYLARHTRGSDGASARGASHPNGLDAGAGRAEA
jgi:hypothetical protein